jgi:maltose alpha-D-glucosyltransferase/alpha-amylase
MIDLWYKDAIIYELDVKTFQDSNDDGVGDFQGLIRRLPHIAGLGATCLWLQPFYPSPNRDDGYDVTDYYGIDPRLGTLGDFVDFMRQARERGFRVLADLVVNHTSNEHPWFRSARKDRNSPYRDYYIWSESKPKDAHEGIVFPGVQESVWSYDEEAGAYYHHQFYAHQPDLNIANPAVRDEICKIMGFWLELGLSGFRLDAAPFLVGRPAKGGESSRELFDHLEEFRLFLSWRSSAAIILAEANVPYEEVAHYFGPGTQLHMLFNFLLNQYLFLSLARQSAAPLAKILKKLPDLPITGQWANFLRNHDELDLGRLTDEERDEVYAEFAPDEEMRAYNRGIRRRLAPMLDGDRRRQELAYSLLLTLPGTPVLRYGDEVGMGEDLSLPERFSVRTPMQWCPEENAGFTSPHVEQTVRPVIQGGKFGSERVNVADQQRDARSLLNWMEHLIRVRKECPEFGWGDCTVLKTSEPSILTHRCQWKGGSVIAIHNMAKQPVTVQVKLHKKERLVELLGDRRHRGVDDPQAIELAGYGYRWFRVTGDQWRQF